MIYWVLSEPWPDLSMHDGQESKERADKMVVQSFDNFEDMMKAVNRGVERAKASATPRQNAITFGDYWMAPRPDWDLVIFGYVMTEDELYSSSAYNGVDPEEIEYEKAAMAASYADGFRFGRAYSVACPEGELGDSHVCTMIQITKEQFERAKDNGWDLSDEEVIWFG